MLDLGLEVPGRVDGCGGERGAVGARLRRGAVRSACFQARIRRDVRPASPRAGAAGAPSWSAAARALKRAAQLAAIAATFRAPQASRAGGTPGAAVVGVTFESATTAVPAHRRVSRHAREDAGQAKTGAVRIGRLEAADATSRAAERQRRVVKGGPQRRPVDQRRTAVPWDTMRETLLAAAGLILAVSGGVRATTGTCTILDLHQPSLNLDFDFTVPIADDLAMPVEFDEAAGTFAMQRDAWSQRFGDTGAQYDTLNGIHGFLTMRPGTVGGTMDAAGNVTLPRFAVEISTDFESLVDPSVQHLTHIPIMPPMSTGITQTTIGGQPWASEGVALDFTTGVLTLAGTDVLRNAAGSNSDNASGMLLRCGLSPIPARTRLPRAPALRVRGTVKAGAADKGDALALQGKLRAGKTPLAIDPAADLFIRLAAGGHETALLLVPAGTLVRKGHTLRVTDADGTHIHVLVGRRSLGAAGSAPTAGTVTLRVGKRSAAIAANVHGLGLAAFVGAASVTVAAGAQVATAPAAVRGSGAVRRFH